MLGFNIDGFGGTFGGRDDDDEGDVDGCDEEEFGIMKRWARNMKDLWIEPRQGAVAKAVDRWWWRCAVLVVLPASLVSEISGVHFLLKYWNGDFLWIVCLHGRGPRRASGVSFNRLDM